MSELQVQKAAYLHLAGTGKLTKPEHHPLADLVSSLIETKTLDATVDQIVRFAQDTIDADHAGITLIKPKNKGFDTVAATDQVVWEVDELQHELREGPCVQAADEGHTLWSDDIRADPRWPNWGPAAADRGLRSVLSVEMHHLGERVGAMNLFGNQYSQFSRDDALTARLFAYHAASALAADKRERGLRDALDSRGEIGQAQGILMERFGINADQAFNVLRRYSQDRNVKVSRLAHDLIHGCDLGG